MNKLKMKVMEVSYTKEIIKELEKKVISPKVTILEETLNMKDKDGCREKAFENMKKQVERLLENGEEIILKTIVVPNKNFVATPFLVDYNNGIFLSNKRIFRFKMDYEYKIMDKIYVNTFNNIKYIENDTELGEAGIRFKDDELIRLKAYRKEDKGLLLIMLKILTENGIVFKDDNMK